MNIYINKLFLLGIITIFFILIEISFFLLITQIYTLITIVDLFSWLILTTSIYFLFCFLILSSKTFKLFLSSLSLLVYIILISVIEMQLTILRFLMVCIILFSFILSFKNIRKQVNHRYLKFKKRFKIILIICIIISVSFLIFPVRYITIRPKHKIEIIFFTSATAVPNDNETLLLCSRNDISFAVALRESDIEKDGDKIEKKLLDLYDYNVGYYIVIGGDRDDGGFYLTIDNTDHFLDYYIAIRRFLCNIKISNETGYPVFFRNKGFMFDAEPNRRDTKKIESLGVIDKYKYLSTSKPNETQISEAQDNLDELFAVIENDRIDIGIIKTPTIYDEMDDDKDHSILTGTIYNLNLSWDYSATMLYRTRNSPDIYEYLMYNTREYFIKNPLLNIEVEKEIMPLHSFYTKIHLELGSNDIDVPNNKKYIFIGTFHKEFKHTSYLENKDYLKDIDICRHFKINKIFIYDWENFRKCYGEEGIKDIVEYMKEGREWILTLPNYSLQKEILILLVLSFHDRIFPYLEN